MPGKNEPSGFILTTLLGVVGAFVATTLAKRLDGIALMRAQDPLSSLGWCGKSALWRVLVDASGSSRESRDKSSSMPAAPPATLD
jgi:hypothetical protein